MIQVILNIITLILFLIFIRCVTKTIKYYENKIKTIKVIVHFLKAEQDSKLRAKQKYINRKRVIDMCENIERIIEKWLNGM